MARIILFTDLEEGHVFPTFRLAKQLEQRGHTVTYLAMEDNAGFLQDAGLKARIIFKDVYPAGTRKKTHVLRQSNGNHKYQTHLIPMLNGTLDGTLAELKPDLILTSYFLPLESLIMHYKYRISQVFFNPSLRPVDETPRAECMEAMMALPGEMSSDVLEFMIEKAGEIETLHDLTIPLGNIPELILCPREFEFPDRIQSNANTYYIGPCVREESKSDFLMQPWNDGKTLIYVSFGSQASLYLDDYRKLVKAIIEIGKQENYSATRFFISLGPLIEPGSLGPLPKNVSVAEWLPQTELLKLAAVAVIHGGLGTIKECVYHGVPMLVFPMSRDQPENAARVALHQIGITRSLQNINTADIESCIRTLRDDAAISKAVLQMQKIFRKADEEAMAIPFLENLLSQVCL